jgi:putative ABC transport system permease protein
MSGAPGRSVAVDLYRRLIRVFPASFRAEYGEEMADAFASQWREARHRERRVATLVRAFGRLPAVVVAEWWEAALRVRGRRRDRRRGGGVLMGSLQMIRYGVRSLLRTPAFTLGVVLLLGLGVGSASAIYAVVDHVLLRSLPYPSVERLFEVQRGSHSGPSFEDFHGMGSVERWAAAATEQSRLTGEGTPLSVKQTAVTGDFFALFGARPSLGRLFIAEDYRALDGVVLSHGAWRRIFGGDAGVVGRTIRIDGEPRVVLGVLDPSFVPPETLLDPSTEVWRPLDLPKLVANGRSHHTLSVAGRLRAGATLADAQRDADRLAEERAQAFPDQYLSQRGEVRPLPLETLQEATVGRVRRGLGLLFGAVGLLLLVACANVTHLVLARGVARVREMSVRRALGAGTGAVAGQLLVESLLLGAGGAVVGGGLAAGAVGVFRIVNPGGLPRVDAIAVDARVLAFAALVGMATAVVFGLVPALRLTGGSVAGVLRDTGRTVTASRRAQRLRNGIVVVEVALSLVLVAQAGWLMRSFIRLHQQPLGFRTERVATLPLTPTGIETVEEWLVRMEAIRASLAATPGVERATYGLGMPLQYTGGGRCCWHTSVAFDGAAEKEDAVIHPVDTDYFDVFALGIAAGRTWRRAEAGAAVRPALVSEPLAVAVHGSAADAVGRTLVLDGRTFQIIGVVADHRHFGPDQEHGAAVFVPIESVHFKPYDVHLAVLTAANSPDLYDRLRAAVWRVEPDLPVPVIRPMAEWAGAAVARSRFQSALVAAFAGVALLLVAAGLAGTLLYSVSLQRRDLGIRLALGATAGRLERRFLGRGLSLAALGAVIGAAGAWATGRLIESRLFGVDARDARTLALATAVLLFSALMSSWLPARRAARTDPLESLRVE